MGLLELKYYLQQQQRFTLKDIAYHFDIEIDLAKMMLNHWIYKGKVEALKDQVCNKGCCQANLEEIIFYQWIGY